jgi:hypothetical protein
VGTIARRLDAISGGMRRGYAPNQHKSHDRGVHWNPCGGENDSVSARVPAADTIPRLELPVCLRLRNPYTFVACREQAAETAADARDAGFERAKSRTSPAEPVIC